MSRLPHDQIERILELEIETLALSEAELIARVADLESERDTYQILFKQSLDALHQWQLQHTQQRRTIAELRELLRRVPEMAA